MTRLSRATNQGMNASSGGSSTLHNISNPGTALSPTFVDSVLECLQKQLMMTRSMSPVKLALRLLFGISLNMDQTER